MGSIKGIPRGKYKTYNFHPGGNYHCSECGNGYKRKTILLYHIRKKHLLHRVSCPKCKRKYSSMSDCKRHIRNIHTVNKPKMLKGPKAASIVSSFENLSYPENPKYPGVASVISIAENATYGKHVIAKYDLEVGQVIIAATAFASVEVLSSVNKCCFNCGKHFSDRFVQCKHCSNLWFCTKRCSLNQAHRAKCQSIFNYNDCCITRIVTEVIISMIEKMANVKTFLQFCRYILLCEEKPANCTPDEAPFSQYAEILRLKGRREFEHIAIANRVMKRVKSLYNVIDDRTLFYIACRHASAIRMNSFMNKLNENHGICTYIEVYDFVSRFNHSCAANVVHFTDESDKQKTMRCVVVRPIEKGEQVFLNYLYGLDFEDSRNKQDFIMETWAFSCNCEKCCSSSVSSGSSDDDRSLYQYIKENFNSFRNNRVKRANIQKKCLEYLHKYGCLWSDSTSFVIDCLIFLIVK